jgi:hypothetical protein
MGAGSQSRPRFLTIAAATFLTWRTTAELVCDRLVGLYNSRYGGERRYVLRRVTMLRRVHCRIDYRQNSYAPIRGNQRPDQSDTDIEDDEYDDRK